MELLPAVFSSGWASGVNAYLVVLALGFWGRATGADAVPDALMRTDVLVAAGAMFAIEFVTDKIPYVDSLWDTVSTAIRPTVGAIIGLLLAGDASSVEQATMATVGGGSALASHLVKAGIRLAVNGSPEPVSNVSVSLGEDVTVAGVVTLVVFHPWWALGISATLLVLGIVIVVLLLRWVRQGWRRRNERRLSGSAAG
ncbi:MAG: DUF4126 domain-containing protein [Nocardioidaceae bacterium]|nr:DUF4126 domain-containing protein [Nocardioidaceae bacterium]